LPFCVQLIKKFIFVKQPSNSCPHEQPLVVFGARLIQNQIVMEQVSFWFAIIKFNKTCFSQMCNANNLFLIIGAIDENLHVFKNCN
jgi:hypothetical protein